MELRETERETLVDKVISVDPGGTTGIAIYDKETREIETLNLGPEEHHLDLFNLLTQTRAKTVLCETFEYRRKNIDEGVAFVIISREYIGVCKVWTKLTRDRSHLIMQTPAQAKAFWTDKNLKDTGFWSGKTPHERDAVRHLMYHLATRTDHHDLLRKAKML
jgi:hypothetical protein